MPGGKALAGVVWQAPVFQMAGIALFEDAGFPYVPTGDYAIDLIKTEAWSQDGVSVSSVIFKMKIAEEGPHKGKEIAKWIGLEGKEGNARGWKQAYRSFGMPAQNLETNFQPQMGHFTPQPGAPALRGYVHVDSPPQSEAKIKSEDVTVIFLQPTTYQERKAAGITYGSAAPLQQQASQQQAPQAAPPPPAGASFPGFGVQPGQQPGLPSAPPLAAPAAPQPMLGQPAAPVLPNGAPAAPQPGVFR